MTNKNDKPLKSQDSECASQWRDLFESRSAMKHVPVQIDIFEDNCN